MTHPEKLRWRACSLVLMGIAFVLIVIVYRDFQSSGIRDQESVQIPLNASHRVRQTRRGETYRRLPLSFEENQGQIDEKVKFLSRGNGYTLFLTPTEAVLTLRAQTARAGRRGPSRTRSTVLRMKLVGANPSPKIAGLDELPGKSNYFIGSDPARWRTNVATYAKVQYRDAYPGIDLVYYGNQRQLEYDWIVSPGANPDAIGFAVEGARRMKVDSNGDFVLTVFGGEVRLHKPMVYQETDGVRREIAGSFVQKSKQDVGFTIADYDTAKPLVIDPVLHYSTYLGGNADDFGYAIAVDSSNNTYVTGNTNSTNFPIANPLQSAHAGSGDAFVTKFSPSGSALVYSTYLGGSGSDVGFGIAVDSSGSAYVTGYTDSTNFPTVNPRQPAYGGGSYDAFVTKFNPSGSALVYSTYHGASGGESGGGIAVDSSGNAYVTGSTHSNDFPTVNPRQPVHAGGLYDVFVTKLNSSGSALVYSTYHGGAGLEGSAAIAVDALGNAYVTGYTTSINFPTANPLQPASAGSTDAFVTKFNPSGSALIYSTYHGGSGLDSGEAIAVDVLGNAYVTGSTLSTDFPTASPRQPAKAGDVDVFLSKFNPSGSVLVYSTYHGGNRADYASAIAADSMGNAYLTGNTGSTDFPTTDPLQPANPGSTDAFVTKFNPSGSTLVYSTYLGGNGYDVGYGIAVDSSGNAYVTGHTGSPNFPTANPLQPVFGAGQRDAFVTKIGELVPTFEITMSAGTYIDGETVTALEFRPQNPTAVPVAVKLRVWLSVPEVGEVNLVDIGADGSFFLPPNLNQNIGPLSLFVVTQVFPPKGNWQFNSRIENPNTGALLSEDINPFVIH